MDKQTLQTGGLATIDNQFIICKFKAPRTVLSTSLYNGGFLTADAVFNHRLNFFVSSEKDLPGQNVANYLAHTAQNQGLDPDRSTGLITTARMHCHSYQAAAYEDLIVEVFATAGVDKNAMRAGDSASYREIAGEYKKIGGTINLMVLTNTALPPGAMVKALVTITEGKTAALQELAVTSTQTGNLATGTGTDGVILAADPKSRILCTDTGTQAKLGELIAKAVRLAVKNSLARECGLTPQMQASVLKRLQRLDKNLKADVEGPQARLLTAMAQSIWQEYRWQLLDQNELYLFCSWLEKTPIQPLGKNIAAFFKLRSKQLLQNNRR